MRLRTGFGLAGSAPPVVGVLELVDLTSGATFASGFFVGDGDGAVMGLRTGLTCCPGRGFETFFRSGTSFLGVALVAVAVDGVEEDEGAGGVCF